MANPLGSKYAELNDTQLSGMITYAQTRYPFLEFSSSEALFNLCRMMLDTHFILDKKATPIRASYEFLRTITETNVRDQRTGALMFTERDFVFAIKMFGLRVRVKNGVKQFVPDNEIDAEVDDEFNIDDAKSAKTLAFYVSDVQKRTKIQTHAIESASNRLLRDWREIELAKLFADMISREGRTIGQARDFLLMQCNVKPHEFVRIREHAIEMGLFKSKRSPSKTGRRVTLDEDVAPYVEDLTTTLAPRRKNPLTSSQAVNQALRDLYRLVHNKPFPKEWPGTSE